MSEPFTIAEAKFTIAELKALSLKPGDVLTVKLVDSTGLEIFTQQDMLSLRAKLKEVFKDNEIMVFAMPQNTDIVFESVGPETKSDCSPYSSASTGYCSDCSCGKKEAFLANPENLGNDGS
jgi:hypothetical protein